jgi:hypothetical protein
MKTIMESMRENGTIIIDAILRISQRKEKR